MERMKKLLNPRIVWLLLFVLTFTQAYAQKGKQDDVDADTTDCLLVTGKFDASMKHFEGTYKASLIRDNKVEEFQEVKVKKSFTFILRKNFHYSIKIEKPGYIYKLISVSTVLPHGTDFTDMFKFTYQTSMIAEDLYHHFDDDDMDFPMALVEYKRKCDCFEYDAKYTAMLIERILNTMMYGVK